ncbi:mannitol dehydrogenase family protein [Parvularcula dongshanensis]|uniref:Fructuronate reductase n=1 Tax=Parvularcula dongshanensis TaxID=1173995 RepID=A0A840I591_9PROT|nr:mannitol dehydrogenase family protein [Parvularcula dongshanensis]MBB4659451.1 fructuronate reductase [Parvularcula dongshanensis]
MTDRLSEKTLDQLSQEARRPGYDRATLRPRMVHLGVGAFHRAHQAVCTEDAIEAKGGDWGVTGISLRSDTAETQLAPQDGLFTVGTREGQDQSLRLIGNLTRVLTAPKAPQAVRAALAAPDLSVVTLTITEKGYALDPATGNLRTDAPEIAADLRSPREPASAIGYLVEAFRNRREASLAPFTTVSCDNLPSNGERLRSAVLQFAGAVDKDLASWIEAEAAFPETMVDRIVPAVTEEDLARAEAQMGLRDEGHIATEPFFQWAIEDSFCGPRPSWEAGGALFVSEVAPYEAAKLRLLNGPHSAIAYLGYLAGHTYVHQVMADEDLCAFVTALMEEEIAPTVKAPDGFDLASYTQDLRDRFRNPALNHRTWQIAMDGSQKLPQRLLNTIRDRRAAGAPIEKLATAVAAWMAYARGRDLNGEPIDVRDPMKDRLAEIGGAGSAADLVSGYLALKDVFGDDLPRDEAFRTAVTGKLEALLAGGVTAALRG